MGIAEIFDFFPIGLGKCILIWNEEPIWIKKYKQGIVYYCKNRIEKIWTKQKQMLLHRSLTNLRIPTGVLS